MFKSLVILGRQKELSLAELESLFESAAVQPVGSSAALLDVDSADVNFTRLGGAVKLCKVLTTLPTVEWKEISQYLINNVPAHSELLPAGKLKFGLSVYDLIVKPTAINATGLSVKKSVQATGRSVRVVPNQDTELNSAQVLHNRLTSELGMELVLVRDNSSTILAQTTRVQDINAYAARDQKRPKRDARIGMLPPKLAQIIINLASTETTQSLLDPFCGTGVLLQEACIMGLDVVGSDLDARMIDYSKENLTWLAQKFEPKGKVIDLIVGDATKLTWESVPSTIACETYLGRPFSTEPNADKLREVMEDVNTIHRKFLMNVASQTPSGFRMCIAVPAWHTKDGIKHLSVLDRLTDIGYTRMSFVHSKNNDLVYHREGQIVGRELVVLIRK